VHLNHNDTYVIMHRRSFIALSAAAAASPQKKYRVGVVGHTGQGNYGHGIDLVWSSFDQIEVVGVADADPAGRAAAMKRIRAARAYTDFREMLRVEKPDLVGVGPRTLGEREQMITAAAAAGAHIFTEKPFAASPVDADRIVEAVRRNKVKLQVAHQMRVSPYTLRAKAMIDAGEIGEIQEIRARGKEDRRAGGEDLMVLGSHLFDMMRFFLGNPKWVASHVSSEGQEMSAAHVKEATEPIGPVAGNQISAMFAFANGVHAFFASRAASQTDPLRFGTWVYGSKGVMFVPMAIYPEGALYLLRSPAWLPDERNRWERVEVTLDSAAQSVASRAGRQVANALMVADLVRAIETNGKPCCSEDDGRWTIEMVHGVYQAQKSGGRVSFPLESRTHALERRQG
jgi:predicted dehydrogenase